MTDTESQPLDLKDTHVVFHGRSCMGNDYSTHPYMYKSPLLDFFVSCKELSVEFINPLELSRSPSP